MKNSAEQITKDETKVFFKQKLKEYSTLSEFKKDLNEALMELKEYPEDNKHQIKFYSEVEIMLDQHIYNSETIQNNKLIAELMGANGEVTDINGDVFLNNIPNPEGGKMILRVLRLKYNTSWDWLMPVVEKILNLQDTYAQERQKVFNSITPSINTTYTAIISFIKWYNENK